MTNMSFRPVGKRALTMPLETLHPRVGGLHWPAGHLSISRVAARCSGGHSPCCSTCRAHTLTPIMHIVTASCFMCCHRPQLPPTRHAHRRLRPRRRRRPAAAGRHRFAAKTSSLIVVIITTMATAITAVATTAATATATDDLFTATERPSAAFKFYADRSLPFSSYSQHGTFSSYMKF